MGMWVSDAGIWGQRRVLPLNNHGRPGVKQLVSGQQSVISGQWSVVSGQWSVDSWSAVGIQWSVVFGVHELLGCGPTRRPDHLVLP